jgi:hypothetical protein
MNTFIIHDPISRILQEPSMTLSDILTGMAGMSWRSTAFIWAWDMNSPSVKGLLWISWSFIILTKLIPLLIPTRFFAWDSDSDYKVSCEW